MFGPEQDQSRAAALTDQINRQPRILFLDRADFLGQLVRFASYVWGVLQVLERLAKSMRPDEVSDLMMDADPRQFPLRRGTEDVPAAHSADHKDDPFVGRRIDRSNDRL